MALCICVRAWMRVFVVDRGGYWVWMGQFRDARNSRHYANYLVVHSGLCVPNTSLHCFWWRCACRGSFELFLYMDKLWKKVMKKNQDRIAPFLSTGTGWPGPSCSRLLVIIENYPTRHFEPKMYLSSNYWFSSCTVRNARWRCTRSTLCNL